MEIKLTKMTDEKLMCYALVGIRNSMDEIKRLLSDDKSQFKSSLERRLAIMEAQYDELYALYLGFE